MKKSILSVIFFFVIEPAAAQVATLKINSDLMIHPDQIANTFMISADRINKSATWDWPEVQFEKPYKTAWTQVQAKGPFQLNVRTELLNARELSFELYWQNPSITVGQFAVKDTVVREIDGVTVIINIEGSCNGINWVSTNGLWKVRGKVQWGIAGKDIQVQWREFQFIANPSAPKPVTNYGACVGPDVIQQTLRENVDSVVSDQAKMQDLLQAGILHWMNGSLHNLTQEIMKSRASAMKENLELIWDPQFMITLPGGMIRVPGYLTLKKSGLSAFPSVIDRTLADEDYAAVTETGFVLPKNAMEHIGAFLHSTGDLTKRYLSTQVKGFQDMFKSSFAANAVWPDLLKFSTSTVFWFDVASDGVPQMGNVRRGSSSQGGLVYDLRAPVVIYDWAPWRGTYYPYVDLRSNVSGTFRIAVKSQNLQMQVVPSSMPLKAQFRSEFKANRSVDTAMDTNRLATSAKDFLNNKVTSTPMPVWYFGPDMKASYGDIKLFRESLMLPVSFVKK